MKKGTKFQHKQPDVPQVCAICGFPLKTFNALGKHVTKYHSNQCTMKEYVDTYVEPYAHKCPYCDNERNFSHGRYKETCADKACIQKHREATNMVKYGNKCSLKGTNEQKVVNAIVEKYGVDNVFKLDSMQQLAKQRIHDKYGKEYVSQVPEIRKKIEQVCIDKFGYKTNLLNPEHIERIKKTCLEKYGNEYVCASEYTRNHVIAYNNTHYGVPWFMQTQIFKDKTRNTCLQRYGVATVGNIPGSIDKRRTTNLQRYGVIEYIITPEARARSREACREKYGVDYVMQNPDMWKRITNGARVNGFMSIVEQKFADLCTDAGIIYKYDEWINQKHWDFTIYCENRLDFVIEIDGEWCHGLVGDSDGKHQVREQKNIERLTKVPDGVKYLCTNSKNIKNAFNYILQYIGCDINVWNDAIYNTLPDDFPYPVYAESRLRKDYQRLIECQSYKGSDLGMCAIYHFHKSLYSYHRDKMISPVNLWTDKGKVLECINSKELYNSPFSSINIVSYLYLSNTARLYSVTSPGMIKYLINTYVPDAYSIIDLFARTGNILLGCACLRKSYVGRALTDTILDELMMMDQYYQCHSQLYTCSDLSTTRYDALVTCIPLDSDADRSINWCIQHIRCSTYMFLARDTRKYEQYVIDNSDKYGDNNHLILIHASDIFDKLM